MLLNKNTSLQCAPYAACIRLKDIKILKELEAEPDVVISRVSNLQSTAFFKSQVSGSNIRHTGEVKSGV